MKKTILLLTSLFVFTLFAFSPSKHSVVGHWTLRSSAYPPSWVSFNSDGTFSHTDGSGKVLHSGKYKFSNDTLSIDDKTCGSGYWGKYKLTFYGSDSASSATISDSCGARKMRVGGATIKKMMMGK
jgi:hypothetical protein